MKRVLSLFIAVLMIVSAIASAVTEVYAASNEYIINGIAVHQDDFSSSPKQCWAYANKVYNKIWGTTFNSNFSDKSNFLRLLSDEELTLTEEHLRKYVSSAALGSSLRICNSGYLHGSDGSGHSQIIVQKDENGFTVFEGGLSSSPYRRERYYTWSEYCSTSWLGGKYAYIKYIKWPGAGTYMPCEHYDTGSDLYTEYTTTGHCSGCGAWLPNKSVISDFTPGVYVTTGSANLRVHPYKVSNADTGEPTVKLSEATEIKVLYAVKNGLNNTWYYVSYGDAEGYVYSGSTKFKSAADPQVTTSGINYPEKLPLGKSYTMNGTITSDYLISEVTIGVYDAEEGGNAALKTATAYPDSKTFDVHRLDSSVKFGTVEDPGTYWYRITIKTGGVTMIVLNAKYRLVKLIGSSGLEVPVFEDLEAAYAAGKDITFIWYEVENATKYRLQLFLQEEGEDGESDIWTSAADIEDAKNGTKLSLERGLYRAELTAINENAELEDGSGYETVPGEPEYFEVIDPPVLTKLENSGTDKGIIVRWENGDLAEMRIDRRASSKEEWKTVADDINGTSYTDPGATEGGATYSYRVVGQYEDLDFASGSMSLLRNPFKDVKDSASYFKALMWAYNSGIVAGTSTTGFSPNDNCTRGQFALMLWRLNGKPDITGLTEPFKDVRSTNGFYKGIVWCYDQGITAGTSATTFSPNSEITRWQLILMLWRMAGKPEPKTAENPFTDVRTSASYYKSALWAYENGITGVTTFSPNDLCTRWQLVLFLYRLNNMYNYK